MRSLTLKPVERFENGSDMWMLLDDAYIRL